MHIDKLTVADVMERNILFYDSGADAACRVICQRAGMSCLPDLSGQRYWLYNGPDMGFTEHPILKEQRVKSRHPLIGANLDGRLMDAPGRFLFVYDKEWLVGTLTVADLYRPVVMQAFQRDLSDFSQLLRQFLSLAGKTDIDVLAFLETHTIGNEEVRRLEVVRRQLKLNERIGLPPFSYFATAELLAYTRSADSGSLYAGYDADFAGERAFERINEIMHQGKETIDRPGSLTDYSSLFSNVLYILNEYNHLREAVLSHPEFIRSRQERNRQALERSSRHDFLPDIDIV